MKKYIFLLLISGIMVGCSNIVEEKKINNYKVEESLSEYSSFEKESLNKYSAIGITDVEVAPYSKGIDILFTTDRKEFSKEEFENMSKERVAQFKQQYKLSQDMKIGVSLDYRKTPQEDVVSLFTADLK